MLFDRAPTNDHRVALIILDGWGEAAAWGGNAITSARLPTFERLNQGALHTILLASGEAVGLPAGEPGNSEVGHLTIGAGRILAQDRSRITTAIDDGSFFRNDALVRAMQRAKTANRPLHLIGLTSHGGVHSHLDHLRALLELAKQVGLTQVAIHAITDGRDALPQQAAQELDQIRHWCTELGVGTIASIVGRSIAMDRDEHWDRIEQAYRLYTEAKGTSASSALAAMSAAYTAGQNDEFIAPVWLDSASPPIQAGDTVILWNFRPDRSRQLLRAFSDPAFTGFRRTPLADLAVVTFIPYVTDQQFPGVTVAFPPEVVSDSLGAVVSAAGFTQLRIAETEKYAHVTYFLNAGHETPFAGEERQLIPSKLTASAADHPAMQTPAITKAVVQALEHKPYDLIVANIAAPDMVGHTGSFAATVAACEAVDSAVATIAKAAVGAGATLVITADHGNAEQLIDPVTNEPDTHHTVNPVPLLLVAGSQRIHPTQQPLQTLADVAPTILTLLGLTTPHSMTGHPLVTLD